MSDRDHTGDDLAAPPPDELAELRALAAEVGAEPASWIDPPAGLWERIAAEAGVATSDPEVEVVAGPELPSKPEPEPGSEPGSGDVVPLAPRRRSGARRAVPWVLGIAAAVLVAVGVGVVASRPSDPDVVASTELDRLGDAGEGRAELLDEDGSYRLRVDTADLDAGDGFLEVWVIDEGVSRLVSLGPIRPDGTYDLPDSIDPRDFPVVDVSVEPVDGDPTHSGDSVLRGTLQF